MRKRILVIENDNDIRDLISYILEDKGYEVIVSNPRPSNQLHNHKADLILLDEWLNEREGHLLCTELKEMHETMQIPVIILSTAKNIRAIAENCKAEGYINKPFDLDELLEEVERCFSASNKSDFSKLEN